jgi:hypothetical protein
MRKLTVKNFSVIKDAELEFGKITVLIGPQSSGKSLLCKLAYFFGQVVPEVYYKFEALNKIEEFVRQVQEEFLDKFPQDSWTGQGFQLRYDLDEFHLTMDYAGGNARPTFKLPDGLHKLHECSSTNPPDFRELDLTQGPPFPISEDSVYVPAGRSFYSVTSRGYAALATKNLDWITQRYATQFDPDYKALLKCYRSDREAPSNFATFATAILKGRIVTVEGRLLFESAEDLRKRSFEILSSGTLELLPLIDSLGQLVEQAKLPTLRSIPMAPFGVFYVEEPELSVFPSTQHELVRTFAWLANLSQLGMSYAITTHSPYILTAFNDLIKAGQIAAEMPAKASEIEKIIPRQYWIKPGDFAAYAFDGKDGILRSIMDDETKMINGDTLDDISSDIADEFGQLLEIQYGG